MSVEDFFKKSVLEAFNFNQAVTSETILQIGMSLLASVLVGMIIYWAYRAFFNGVVFNRSFGMTLVGMTILTCVVTLAISTNIVISLGMVGALSIVRFRTAIKDPADLLYLFWAITCGITVGANMYILAGAAVLIMIIVLWAMHKDVGANAYMLVVHYKGTDAGDEIERSLSKVSHQLKAKTIRGETIELTEDVKVKHGNIVFLEKIQAVDGVSDATLIQYTGEYHL